MYGDFGVYGGVVGLYDEVWGGFSSDRVECGFTRCRVGWGLCDGGSTGLYLIVWSGTLKGMVCRWVYVM